MAKDNKPNKKSTGCGTIFLVIIFILGGLSMLDEYLKSTDEANLSTKPSQSISNPIGVGTIGLPWFTTPSSDSQATGSGSTQAPSTPATQGSTPATQGSTRPATQGTTTPPTPYSGHVYTGTRNKGDCEVLTGKVAVTILFVNDPDGSWTSSEITDFKAELVAIEAKIEAEAATYGAFVDLKFYYGTSSASYSLSTNKDSDPWVKDALKNAGLPELSKLGTSLEGKYGVASAPVIFVANHGGRAFAFPRSSGTEYAVLFEDAHAFYHELSHLYGAKDFYFPQEVEDLAEQYLPDTLMVDSSEGSMDSLTAYLVGWTDQLSKEAKAFLDATAHITQEYLNDEKAKDSYTGYVTNFRIKNRVVTGQLIDGQLHGQATCIWDNGSRYEGNYDYGRFHGYGSFTWADGDNYTGNYIYGVRAGQGTFTYADGTRYTGTFVNGSFQGKGTMTWTNGSSYTGDFYNDKRHGYGTYHYSNGNRYEGDWVEGERTGRGTFTYADGTKYVGDFLKDKFNGQGTMTWTDGSSYTGDYANGQRHGYGTYHYSNGNRYEGDWVEGERNGKGTFTYASGTKYVGDFLNNQFHGKGTMTWVSGDQYTGDFVDGSRTGYGIYTWPNGNRYEGGFKDGQFHGQGTMYYANGNVKSGTWDNGKFVG